ncbi:hypothetical protein S40285_00232 [Stachybotrys chlorohalonatus IBT 40285]|uniref:Transcriptional regulatory protein n=1 Tax=Stachybotrys chlorohalonatus (strain IBT 40285) TaxID=1283841 RepID=A0A084QU45_STAC4|nr:hypothetical protein S40285_00232 [Stachybotrys chlorohalonata IBT 40285]
MAIHEKLSLASLRPLARNLTRSTIAPFVCRQCLRQSFATTAAPLAGHNKWSKTKHLKAVTDKKKMKDRTTFTHTISMLSRLYGEDLKSNPQLVNAIAAATKASIPKALIEAAIARGQGRSTTGAKLEPLTLEILMPPNIALIVDLETDNKTRTMSDVKVVVKKGGALVGSTAFYFSRRGRAVLQGKPDGPGLSDVMEEALEHEGIEDVEELPDGGFLVWTEPARVSSVGQALSRKFGLDIAELNVVWSPNEDTMETLETAAAAESLSSMLANLKEFQEVKAIYANVREGGISDAEWASIEENLDS